MSHWFKTLSHETAPISFVDLAVPEVVERNLGVLGGIHFAVFRNCAQPQSLMSEETEAAIGASAYPALKGRFIAIHMC